ncbi:MAG: CxxC-x17-CxxC domain-containing protein [Patescibacteria group bacterium]
MNNFQDRGGRGGGFRGGASGGRPPFKKSWGGDRGGDRGGDKPMYPATCSKCNKPCEVPFRPMSGKPVFCRDCFNAGRDAGDARGSRPDFAHRAPRPEFGSKPSFRPDAGASFKSAGMGDDTRKQLTEIGIKLDRLINVVEKMNSIAKGAKNPAMETETPVETASEGTDAAKVAKKKVPTKKKK